MRSCKHTNTIIYGGKQHCNVSNANIGLLEHVQWTCMSDSVALCTKWNFNGYA